MFGSKSEDKVGPACGTTLISKNTEIVGDIHFSGTLVVEGTIKGNIHTSGEGDALARVMETGVIEGDVCVPSLVINGTVNGDVFSSKHIELAAKTVINGNVHYALIEMVKGAQINGNLVYSDSKTSDGSTISSTAVTPIDVKAAEDSNTKLSDTSK